MQYLSFQYFTYGCFCFIKRKKKNHFNWVYDFFISWLTYHCIQNTHQTSDIFLWQMTQQMHIDKPHNLFIIVKGHHDGCQRILKWNALYNMSIGVIFIMAV